MRLYCIKCKSKTWHKFIVNDVRNDDTLKVFRCIRCGLEKCISEKREVKKHEKRAKGIREGQTRKSNI